MMQRAELAWWQELQVVDRIDRPALGAILAAAALADLAVRSGVAALSGSVLVVVVAAGLALRLETRQARMLAASAPLFGIWLSVRMSPWLLPLDILAAAGLLAMAASYARGGDVGRLSVAGALERAAHGLAHGLSAPGFLRGEPRPAPGRGRVLRAAAGAAIGAPVALAVWALLASADPVFASFFRIDLGLQDLVVHAVLAGCGAWGMAALLRIASVRPVEAVRAPRALLGGLEAGIVLGAIAVLFAAFVAAQLVALSAGGRHVIETAGLTYAGYAREGFLQLLGASAITIVTIVLLREFGSAGRSLPSATVVLTLAVCGVALRRMALYVDAYGLTMLRVMATAVMVWLAVVLVLLGLTIVRGSRGFLAGSLTAGLAILFALNVLNPEAVVVRYDAAHGKGDAAYFDVLSPDAVPALIDAVPQVEPEIRAGLSAGALACPAPEPGRRGPASYNASVHRAAAALERYCESKGA